MNPDLSKRAINKIEAICGLGCTQVNQLLEKTGNGNDVDELSGFSESEVKQIVEELGKIMSVYDTDDTDKNDDDIGYK